MTEQLHLATNYICMDADPGSKSDHILRFWRDVKFVGDSSQLTTGVMRSMFRYKQQNYEKIRKTWPRSQTRDQSLLLCCWHGSECLLSLPLPACLCPSLPLSHFSFETLVSYLTQQCLGFFTCENSLIILTYRVSTIIASWYLCQSLIQYMTQSNWQSTALIIISLVLY